MDMNDTDNLPILYNRCQICQQMNRRRMGDNRGKCQLCGKPLSIYGGLDLIEVTPGKFVPYGEDPPPPRPAWRVRRSTLAVILCIVLVAAGVFLSQKLAWDILLPIGSGSWKDNVLMEDSHLNTEEESAEPTVLGSEYLRNQIATITFQDNYSGAPVIANRTWNVAADGSNLVKAWVTQRKSDGLYDLYIAANGGINAANCCELFADYVNVTQIWFNGAFYTEEAADMKQMFSNCASLTDLTLDDRFVTANVTDMSSMFRGCSSLSTLMFGEQFRTENVTDMSSMFRGCSSLKTLNLLPEFATNSVTDMNSMFRGCSSLTSLKASESFVIKGLSLQDVFRDCSALTELVPGSITVTPSSDVSRMFAGTPGIQAADLTHIDWSVVPKHAGFLDGTGWEWLFDTDAWMGSILMADSVSIHDESKTPVFGSKYLRKDILSVTVHDTLEEAPESAWDVSEDGSGRVLAWVIPNGTLYDLHLAGYGGINAKNCKYLFRCYSYTERIDLSGGFHTTEADDMRSMFAYCQALATLSLGEHFDTSSVGDMGAMFYNCSALQTLSLGKHFDTSCVWNMYNMFCGCKKLSSLSLGEHFDTSKVTVMAAMFCDCEELSSLSLGEHFDTSKVTDMSKMFKNCENLSSLTLGKKFSTASVKYMNSMFENSAVKLEDLEHVRWSITAESKDFISTSGWERLFWKDNILMSVRKLHTSSYFSEDEYILGSTKYRRNQIRSVTFLDHLTSKPSDAWDVSSDQNGRVWAWVKSSTNGMYDLYIGAKYGVSASDCRNLFDKYVNVEKFNFDNCFHTENVTSMFEMFDFCKSVQTLDLKSLDTGNVTNMKWMFFGCENLDTLIVDKQRFASNATTVQGMFKNTKIDKNDVDGIRWHKDAVGQWEIQ